MNKTFIFFQPLAFFVGVAANLFIENISFNHFYFYLTGTGAVTSLLLSSFLNASLFLLLGYLNLAAPTTFTVFINGLYFGETLRKIGNPTLLLVFIPTKELVKEVIPGLTAFLNVFAGLQIFKLGSEIRKRNSSLALNTVKFSVLQFISLIPFITLSFLENNGIPAFEWVFELKTSISNPYFTLLFFLSGFEFLLKRLINWRTRKFQVYVGESVKDIKTVKDREKEAVKEILFLLEEEKN